MKPNPRSQIDDKGDEYSDLTGLVNTDKMITRQEFKDEADINLLLLRFGVTTGPPGTFGEVDYTIDLQLALNAIQEANRAQFQVPDELQQKYRTWRDVLNAAETGEYAYDLNQLQLTKNAAKQAAAAEAQQVTGK